MAGMGSRASVTGVTGGGRYHKRALQSRSSILDTTVLRSAALVVIVTATLSSSLRSQEPGERARAGITGGVVRFGDGRTEQVLTGILEYDPTSWLSLSVVPSGVRVSRTLNGQSTSRSGLADLPVSAAALYTLPGGGSPSLGVEATVVLPTGNASCGLGSGVTSLAVNGGLGVTPLESVRLSLDASRSLTGGVAQSALTAPRATWVSSTGSVELSSRWSATLSYGADVGTPDSGRALSRELGGGVSYTLASALALTVDASHGLTPGSPRWVLSLGVGTAFAGTSPVLPTAPARRLQTTFGGTARTSGSTGTTCR
jgi:outer membrane putative beta-barrel porin/alpha-amylase